MRAAFFFLLFCYLQGPAQQSVIKGIVSIHNSETETGTRQYVINAQVEDESGKAQPRVTDEQGQFGLSYVGIPDKTSVSFVVKKTGLQVVNTDALNAVTGQNKIIKISMA